MIQHRQIRAKSNNGSYPAIFVQETQYFNTLKPRAPSPLKQRRNQTIVQTITTPSLSVIKSNSDSKQVYTNRSGQEKQEDLQSLVFERDQKIKMLKLHIKMLERSSDQKLKLRNEVYSQDILIPTIQARSIVNFTDPFISRNNEIDQFAEEKEKLLIVLNSKILQIDNLKKENIQLKNVMVHIQEGDQAIFTKQQEDIEITLKQKSKQIDSLKQQIEGWRSNFEKMNKDYHVLQEKFFLMKAELDGLRQSA